MAKPYITSTTASNGSKGTDGEELELPEPESPRPASTNPATTECAICLDGDAEYGT